MPAGDANRTWFPEMITMLKDEWNRAMSWTDVIVFRDRLNNVLQTIRTERNIRPPMMWCKKWKSRRIKAEIRRVKARE